MKKIVSISAIIICLCGCLSAQTFGTSMDDFSKRWKEDSTGCKGWRESYITYTINSATKDTIILVNKIDFINYRLEKLVEILGKELTIPKNTPGTIMIEPLLCYDLYNCFKCKNNGCLKNIKFFYEDRNEGKIITRIKIDLYKCGRVKK